MNVPLITLREITAGSLRDILNLSVREEQMEYVASNAVSIAQAHFHPEAWFRGIYRGDIPIGFAMLEDPSLVSGTPNGRPIMLWRFMIDKAYQGKGYGSTALKLISDHVRSRSDMGHFLATCVEGPHSPKAFYLRCGFVETGDRIDGETVLRFDIN